jgi:hypothetical protein
MPLETRPLDQSFAREVVGPRLWDRKTIQPPMSFAPYGHIIRCWCLDARPFPSEGVDRRTRHRRAA